MGFLIPSVKGIYIGTIGNVRVNLPMCYSTYLKLQHRKPQSYQKDLRDDISFEKLCVLPCFLSDETRACMVWTCPGMLQPGRAV